MALIEVKLRPTGPWRAGHRAGDRERVDVIYHSDALYSAITHAMRVLGWMEAWLDATARSGEPTVRFSSLFPFVGKTRLIAPPKPFGIRLVPLELARGGPFDRTRWQADVPSECLLPQGSHPPFQVSIRSAAAVDRLTGAAEPHRIACLEFAPNAGWWGVFDATPEWEPKVKSAFRLLADSGFGGERSRGWGRASEPTFSTASALFPDRTPNGEWWLLGLFSPHAEDRIDWSKSEQTVTVRGGWTDSPAGSGVKKQLRMVEEGAVLSSDSLMGRAVDVAPDDFPHPVYRSGQALAVPRPTAQPDPEPLPNRDREEVVPESPEPEPETLDTRLAGASIETLEPEPDPEPTESLDTRLSGASAEVPEPEPETLPNRDREEAAPESSEPEPETLDTRLAGASIETLEPDPEPQPEPDPEPTETQDTRLSGASVEVPETPEPETPAPEPDPPTEVSQ